MLSLTRARVIISNYTGLPLSALGPVQVYRDPYHDTTYAIRAFYREANHDFLLVGYGPFVGVATASDLLEEVIFKSWPPTSNNP